jgi:hypothetical protein
MSTNLEQLESLLLGIEQYITATQTSMCNSMPTKQQILENGCRTSALSGPC